ncbi:MAG TPA: deaminase [Candidatus Paceibacterota bacterium]|nr:deaminase [Candidatus Paceibacterota bacterium]HPT40165.1 deaminase [Candidatus Paceibacterota bacterium]
MGKRNRMVEMYGERPAKDVYYLGIAEAVRLRSTCIVRFGAIIVKDDQIVATGYNGSPRGTKSCLEKGFCLRRKLGIPSGSQYELCASVHAEMNDIVNSARAGVSLLNGDIYIFGEYDKNIIKAIPCSICKRMIINAGLVRVICSNPESPKNPLVFLVKDWVEYWKTHNIDEDPEAYGKDFCLR